MECLSDPVCLYGAIVDAFAYGAAFLDYLGASLVGERWEALSPIVEDVSLRLVQLVSLVLPTPVDTCGYEGVQGMLHA